MVAPIVVKIDGETDALKNALNGASKSISLFGHDIEATFPKADFVVDVTKQVAKVTKDAAVAAKDAAAEEKIFADAMVAAGAAAGTFEQSTDAAIKASQRLAFTDTETRKALASLTTATGDADQAIQLLAVSQDVARLAGVDLEAASDAVAKAQAGQDAALKRMLPGLAAGATAQETIANASELAAGAADTYATSAVSMSDKIKIAFGELAEEVGAALGPSLRELWNALKPLLVSFGELAAVILPPLLKLLDKLLQVATKIAPAITKIVNAVTKLISKIKELLAPLSDAVNKLRELDFNPFNSVNAAAATAASVSGRATTTGGTRGGGVVFNIYGDPAVIEAKVIKALRNYQARNGVGSVLTPGRS